MYTCVTFSSETSLEASKVTSELFPVNVSVYTFYNTDMKCTTSTSAPAGTPVENVITAPLVV